MSSSASNHNSHPAPALNENATTSVGWFKLWLDSFGDNAAGIWQPNRPGSEVGIPYQLDRLPIGMLNIRVARAAANDHTPRYDILGHGTVDYELFRTMMNALGAHCLVFPYLEKKSRLLSGVDTRERSWCYHLDFCEHSPYVDCTGEWVSYWSQRGKTRSTWARRERRLVNDEGARLRVLTDWEEIEPVWDRVLEIEASGWKGEMGSAIAQSRDTRSFYSRLVPSLAGTGNLKLFLLELPETGAIAFQVAAFSNGVLYQLKIGYDQDYRKASPGQVLQLQLLRWCFEQSDVRAFDFLGGGGKAAANKHRWSADVTPLYTLYVFSPDIQGRLMWLRYKVAPELKARLRKRFTST